MYDGQLQKFRCARGSSPLEGYHTHLERRCKTMLHATSAHKDEIIFAFDTRWSMLALREIGLDRTGVKHFDIALIEGYDASRRAIFGFCAFERRGLHHYVPLLNRPPVLKFGVEFSAEAWSQTCAMARDTLGLPAQMVPLHKLPTSDDTEALLQYCVANEGHIDFAKLAQVGNARGLLFSKASAETWLVGVQNREVAFLDLHSARYGDFIRSLHDAIAVPDAHRNALQLQPNIATAAASDPIALPAPAASVSTIGAIVARPPAVVVPAVQSSVVVSAAHSSACACVTCLFGDDDDDDNDDDDGVTVVSATSSSSAATAAAAAAAAANESGSDNESESESDSIDLEDDDSPATRRPAQKRERTLAGMSSPARQKRRNQNKVGKIRFACPGCKPHVPCSEHMSMNAD